MRVVLVGGGIMGLLSAYELVQAGCEVVLFDKSNTGTEASWAGGGIASPLYPWRYESPITALATWGQGYYPQLTDHLREVTGIDPEYNPCGLLMLDAEDETAALQWSAQYGRAVTALDGAGARELEPHLECAVARALWMPQVGSIRNPRLLQSLRQYLLAHEHVELHDNEAVVSLECSDNQARAIVTDKGRYVADAFVVCAGAWSSALLQPLGLRLPVKPVRGQMVAIQAPVGYLQHIVLRNGTYVVPRKDGLILAGSTLEFVGFDKGTTEAAREFLLGRAYDMMPILQQFPVVAQWAGLRPGSPDGIPFVGELESARGLFVNAGHYRNGLVLAPAACRLLVDQVLQRETILDPRPYLPEQRLREGVNANPEWH